MKLFWSLFFFLLFFFISLSLVAAQSVEDVDAQKIGNVWTQNCRSCHQTLENTSKLAKNRSDQYMFNFIYDGDDHHRFKVSLKPDDMSFLVRYLKIVYYLDVLERRAKQLPKFKKRNFDL
jgi:hypothetical protein